MSGGMHWIFKIIEESHLFNKLTDLFSEKFNITKESIFKHIGLYDLSADNLYALLQRDGVESFLAKFYSIY